MKDHYQTLGVLRDASNESIKNAYMKLALKFHPDENEGDKFFEDRFKEVQEAYETLSDPFEKEKYDDIYDNFLNGKLKTGQTKRPKEELKYEIPKPGFENLGEDKNGQENRDKEKSEKERVANIKKNTELQFEDKAWIFLGNWLIIPGVVGLYMFFKYRDEGYTKKSNTVCSLTVVSIFVLLILAILLVLAQEAGRSRY